MSNLDFSKQELPFELPQSFSDFLSEKVNKDGLTTINLRDSGYSAKNGGFRPVEILVEKKGDLTFLHYVTEFAYFGHGCFSELSKSCDFDFALNIFNSKLNFPAHTPSEPLSQLAEFFELYSNNFVSYVEIGLLDQVRVSTDEGHLAL